MKPKNTRIPPAHYRPVDLGWSFFEGRGEGS